MPNHPDGVLAETPLRVGLVGIGGFGKTLLQYIGTMQRAGRFVLAAACDVQLDRYGEALAEEPFAGVRTYEDYDAFLDGERGLDAVILATPIPLHVEMGLKAMAAGYHVMLEKPPALTIQDLDRMITAQQGLGHHFAVGFQHTSEQSFQVFCDRLRQGRIGALKEIVAKGLWKRPYRYFSRTPWAGRLVHEGNYVLDGTLFNPFSHLLLNGLILAGLQSEREILPVTVQAELYRANAIAGEDTSCLRAVMSNEVKVFFCASICAETDGIPAIRAIGDRGWGSWGYDGRICFGEPDGSPTEILHVESDRRLDHLVNFADVLQGRAPQLSCTLGATRKFVLTANLAFESAKRTVPIGEPWIIREEESLSVRDIAAVLERAADSRRLFSELDVPWARGTAPVAAEGYKEFKLFRGQEESS